jgi:hypothetical protein
MQLLRQATIGAFDGIQIRAAVDAEKVIGVHGLIFERERPRVNHPVTLNLPEIF